MTANRMQSFQLAHPPVRRVRLTVEFSPEPEIQGWQMAPLVAAWTGRYDRVVERAPKHGDHHEESVEVLPDEGPWPLARLEFFSQDRSLTIQGDQLQITWRFGEESANESEYVGFESLISDLEKVYQELDSTLEKHTIRLLPQRVECHYVNAISELHPAELAVGVLTGWPDSPVPHVEVNGYVGVRLHACATPDTHNCSSLLMVDSQDEGFPLLSIQVGRPVSEEDDALAALREAHDELIALFKTHTPKRLRDEWGESQ